MSDRIEVSTNLIAALATWARTDAADIVGVVHFGGDRITATDGHRCVVVPHPTHGHTFGVVRAHLIAAVAAQNVLARDGIDPPIGYDLVQIAIGKVGLADGPCGDRTIKLAPDDHDRIAIDIGGPVVAVPRRDVSKYPSRDRIDALFTGPRDVATPDGYVIDVRYLAAITAINNATAGYSDGVRVTHWTSRNKDGKRGALILEGETGVRFAIMPHIDMRGEPS
jgi:hypothetical protein